MPAEITEVDPTPLASITVTSMKGPLPISVGVGQTLFVLGRNGTGKSAFVQSIIRQIGRNVVYVPGSRPSYFENDSLSMTPASRQQYSANSPAWDQSPDIRVRPITGTTRNEKAIYDLQSAEIQYKVDAADSVANKATRAKTILRLSSKSSPLDRANRLLAQANLPVQVLISNGELRASRDGSVYSISKMSDGERSALVLILEAVSAKPKSIFIIDEPELHLHRSIVVPLISSIITERLDCSFIVSTHELELPSGREDASVLLVRGCTWNPDGSTSNWDVDYIPHSREISEELRIDLLGSRRKIVFVEGTSTSLDQPMYALLFPAASVRCKESCLEVRRAVSGLRQVETLHHAKAFGLVDGDGMDSAFIEKLKAEGVFAIHQYSVEALYYAPELLEDVATLQAATFGEAASAMLQKAKADAITVLNQPAKLDHLEHVL